jgi:anaerobic magnesium-protoporphyrin IX monomethyl ester cyclase
MREAAFCMMAMARAMGITTVVCSSDATDHVEQYMDHGADHVVLGEGEVTVRELVAVLAEGGSPTEVIGLAPTGRRDNLKDLDALPFPARDLIDMQPYRRAWARHGRFSMNLVTTRGCPFHCNWCAKPIWGQRYAVRSPQNVADEIAQIRGRYGPDHLNFVDDIFGLRPGWLPEFAAEVRSRGIEVPFKCLSRADLLTRDGEVAALREAGCETVWMGAESGSQAILDAMDKGTRVEQIAEATARLREAGIRVGYFLQFGYPGEGPDEIEATRRLVRECRPDDIGISVSYPLPGTRFHERVRDAMGLQRNWIDSDDLSMLYEGPFPSGFYRDLHRVVHKEFRLRPDAPPRNRLGRMRDVVTLPFDERVLRRRMKSAPRPAHAGPRLASQPDLEAVSVAFSRAAPRYDSYVDDHPHLTRLRNKVYTTVERHVPAGARILELNAGSGIDAAELAARGYRVHATDVAPGMLARIAPRAEAMGVADRVTVEACSFLQLDGVTGGPYDAVFSDLGGLNCTSDLAAVARGIDRVLAADGLAVLVIMPPVCLWELRLVLAGKFRQATRRLRPNGTVAHLAGREFIVHYFTPQAVHAAFGSGYEVVDVAGLSVVTPTGESRNLARRHPRTYRALSWLDDRLSAHAPFSRWGDFFVIVMRRREDAM